MKAFWNTTCTRNGMAATATRKVAAKPCPLWRRCSMYPALSTAAIYLCSASLMAFQPKRGESRAGNAAWTVAQTKCGSDQNAAMGTWRFHVKSKLTRKIQKEMMQICLSIVLLTCGEVWGRDRRVVLSQAGQRGTYELYLLTTILERQKSRWRSWIFEPYFDNNEAV